MSVRGRLLFVIGTMLIAAIVVTWRLDAIATEAVEPETTAPAAKESIPVAAPAVVSTERTSKAPAEPAPGHVEEPADSVATVRVRVIDEAGEPVRAAWVGLFDLEREGRAPRGPVTQFEDTYSARVRAETGSDGRASLRVPHAGRWRVWAGKRLWTYAPSGELALDQHTLAPELSLTIRAVREESIVAGTALRPNDVPVRAFLPFFWLEDGELQRRNGWSGKDDGRFAFVVDRPALTGALLAHVYGDALGSVVLDPVRVGDPELVVTLRPRQRFELDVRGPEGEEIDAYSATFHRSILGHWVHDYPGPRKRRGEPAVWGVPSVPFQVRLRAGGYVDATIGPVVPEEVGAVLRVDLEALQRARGRVTWKGEPVEGARVWFTRELRHEGGELEGPNRHVSELRSASPTDTTDADGRFDVALSRSGVFDLLARKSSHGDGRLRDVAVDAAKGVEGLEVELSAGGTIRGRLHAPAGHLPSEAWVYCCGPAESFWTGVDDEGRFYVEDLTAGTWTLALRERLYREDPFDARTGSRCNWSHGGPEDPPAWWTNDTPRFVELEEGETVELEWEAARTPACVLEGRALFDGRALEPLRDGPRGMFDTSERTAYLERDGDPAPRARSRVADDGRFTLAVDEPGVYRLRVVQTLRGGSDLIALDRVELGLGVRSWSLDLPTGGIALRLDDALEQQLYHIVHRWRGVGELRVFTRHPRRDEERGLFRFPRVPAGPGELRLDPWDAPTVVLAEVEVPTGGELEVELP